MRTWTAKKAQTTWLSSQWLLRNPQNTPFFKFIIFTSYISIINGLIKITIPHYVVEFQRISSAPEKQALLPDIAINLFQISLILSAVIGLSLVFFAELPFSNQTKRIFRVYLWKFFGYVFVPLFLIFCIYIILKNNLTGWEYASSQDWNTVAVAPVFTILWWITISVLKNPRLFFSKKLSILNDLMMVSLGVFMLIDPIILGNSLSPNYLGLIPLGVGIGSFFNSINERESLLRQIVASLYKLPDILDTFVTLEERDLALIIVLGKYKEYTSLEREELIKHIVHQNKPTFGQKVLNLTKQIISIFITALLIESPAQYIFTKLIDYFCKK